MLIVPGLGRMSLNFNFDLDFCLLGFKPILSPLGGSFSLLFVKTSVKSIPAPRNSGKQNVLHVTGWYRAKRCRHLKAKAGETFRFLFANDAGLPVQWLLAGQ